MEFSFYEPNRYELYNILVLFVFVHARINFIFDKQIILKMR